MEEMRNTCRKTWREDTLDIYLWL